MTSVVVLLIVVVVSLLISRVATIALTVTGLTRSTARFQARSALTGVGYTTAEAESVVNHPVRRRVVMALMLIGNLGVATVAATLITGFLNADPGESVRRAIAIVVGLVLVYQLSKSRFVDRHLSRLIARALRRFTDLEVRDYDRLLHLSGEYSIHEMRVDEGSWLLGRTLGELRLRDEGVIVLGVERRNHTFLGVPDASTRIEQGDTLILYGRDAQLSDISNRPAGYVGDRHHEAATAEQQVVKEHEQQVADDT